MSLKWKVLLVVCLMAALATVAEAQIPKFMQWNRIDIPLTSNRDYSGGNPYKDLVLEYTFTLRGTTKQVKGYGFWERNRDFKVRTALPPGIWDWTTRCLGQTNGLSCGDVTGNGKDIGLWKTGSVEVCRYNSATCLNLPARNAPILYQRGFLKVPKVNGTNPARYLTYDDGVAKFFWLADTAWEASVDASLTDWATYLDNRKNKKFSVILMAPAPQYSGAITSFDTVAGCNSPNPVPNQCSRMNYNYWDKFDQLVQEANKKGIVVVIAGVIDPVDRGNGTNMMYPTARDATLFARNLAARMAGNFVIFSLGFDDKKDARVADNSTVELSMNQAGGEIQRVAPRHLVTTHLAGASPVIDYDAFNSQTWHKFHLYQSGHAFNLTGACPGVALTQQQCAVKRAREVSLEFAKPARPKPAVNGEAAYEYPLSVNPAPPDNRFGVRHTGYYSVLSGSFGFTLGVQGIFNWSPDAMAALANSVSSADMTILANRFQGRAWYDMKPMHARIKTNQTLLPEEKKMVLAGLANNGLAIGYMPNNPEIEIYTASFPGLTCTNVDWARQWVNPRNGAVTNIPSSSCADGAGFIKLTRPTCVVSDATASRNGDCDWIFELRNTKANISDSGLAYLPSDPTSGPHVMTARSEADSSVDTSAILADLLDSAGNVLTGGIVVSAGGEVLQQQPVVGSDVLGNFLIVWQANDLDGSLDGIFAQRFDQQGQTLSTRFQINTYTLDDQSEPSVTTTPDGGSVIVWTSYGQDGDLGGIYGQRHDATGNPLGLEFKINTYSTNHQGSPLVVSSRYGELIVAWTSDGQDGDGRGVYLQRFNVQGVPVGSETKVNTTTAGDQILSSMRISPTGNLIVEWSSFDTSGTYLGVLHQEYDELGAPMGGEF